VPLAQYFVIGKGKETEFILSPCTDGVKIALIYVFYVLLKGINSVAEKKMQPLSGGHCAIDISRTKQPVILFEPAWT